MARCETCGNEYDKTFTLNMAGRTPTFASLECVIHALAPTCDHCVCKILGHGVEAHGSFYCCAHCAGQEGVHQVQDRAEASRVLGTR